jgi:hypothetical protein
MKPAKVSSRLVRLVRYLETVGLNFGSQTLAELGVQMALRVYLGLELILTETELVLLETEVRKMAELRDIQETIILQRAVPVEPETGPGHDPVEIHVRGNFWPQGSRKREYPLSSGRRW